jgi:MFS family permease
MHLSFKGLWRHTDFLRLWSGQTISVFGSMVGTTALSFTAILFLHATPSQMGLLSALNLAPALLAGLLAGAWVDRLRRRPLLIAADVCRALVLATIPLAALAGVLHIAQLYLVALAVSILTITFDVAYQSYLPALVGAEHVVEGNSKLSASAAVAEFGGFSLGGWLVQLVTPPLAILIDAGSFLVSAFSLQRIRAPEAPVTASGASAEQPDLRREIGAGLRAVWQHPLLRASALSILLRDLASGVFSALVVLYMSQGLGFNPGTLGMIWAVGGVSSFLGAALAPRLTRRLSPGRVMVAGLAIYGFSQLLLPLAQGASLLSAALLVGQQLGDGFFVVYDINLLSLRQSITPAGLLGRVNATLQFASIAATLAGALLGGWLGQALGVRPLLAAAAVATLLSALLLALSPIRGVGNSITK